MVNKFLYPKGGAETYTIKLGEFLKEKGHEVEYFGIKGDVRLENNAGKYASDMDLHTGITLKKITYPVKTVYNFEAKRNISAVLEDFEPDVVHINNFTYHLTPSILISIEKWRKKNKKKCKIVFTAHDANLVCPNHLMINPNTGEKCNKCFGGHFGNCAKGRCIHGSLAKSVVGSAEGFLWKHKKAYEYIDVIICCSRFIKTKLDSNPIFKKKTIVLTNFIDKVSKTKWQKKDYALYFGRYSEEKGVGTLVNVCKRIPQVNFVFAGSGPLEDELKGAPNITNVGFKSGEELEQLIGEALFSICPSEVFENCPFSILESITCRTPVIGADIGGIPELLGDNEVGELFESGNEKQLEEKILDLWNNREKVCEFSKNCEKADFDTIDEYYLKLLDIYA